MVAVTLAFTGTAERGAELVAPLRALATPYMDTLTTVPGAALADIAGDPTDPTPALGHAALVERVWSQETDAFLALAGPGVETPLLSVEIRHLGGALRDSPRRIPAPPARSTPRASSTRPRPSARRRPRGDPCCTARGGRAHRTVLRGP